VGGGEELQTIPTDFGGPGAVIGREVFSLPFSPNETVPLLFFTAKLSVVRRLKNPLAEYDPFVFFLWRDSVAWLIMFDGLTPFLLPGSNSSPGNSWMGRPWLRQRTFSSQDSPLKTASPGFYRGKDIEATTEVSPLNRLQVFCFFFWVVAPVYLCLAPKDCLG